MWDPYTEFESTTLPNGLSVHAAHWVGRPWEAVGFLIHSGAEHDPLGLEGTAHYVEHVVSENAGIPVRDIKSFFANYGGAANLGQTGYPFTAYRFFVPIKDTDILARAFSIFGRMLCLAELKKGIEHERKVILREFHRRYPHAFQLDLDVRKNQALYEGYFLERFVSPLGNSQSIARITQADLQADYDTHYTPQNMSIVGVGGMTLHELVESLSLSPFGVRKEGARTPLPAPTTSVAQPRENRHVLHMEEYLTVPVENGSYRSEVKIPGSINPSVVRIVKDMLNEALTEEVRERRRWTYAIGSAKYNLRHFYRLSIFCDSLPLEVMGEIEDVVERCVTSIGDDTELFEKVRRSLVAGHQMVDLNAKSLCDNALSDLVDYGRVVSLSDEIEAFRQVQMEDIQDILKWLRSEQRWTLLTQS